MSFKTFDLAHDVASIISAVNEVIDVTGSLLVHGAGDARVKTFSNISVPAGSGALGGYWQTVYDSSYASAQSTPLFDMTFGLNTGSTWYFTGTYSSSFSEKTKIYREMASLLLGNPNSQFIVGGNPANECFFLLIKRGVMKDELKKGVTQLVLSGNYSTAALTASDLGGAATYKQTVGGDYAPLFSGSTIDLLSEVGQVWYNAGVIVISAMNSKLPWVNGVATAGNWAGPNALNPSLTGAMKSSSIDDMVYGLRESRVQNIRFQNQTNLYSTVYFCRATNTEFNYSSNPTYLDDAQRIRVTSGSNVLQSRTYITKVGLYDANDNLLAVGSINKPITKTPDTESIFRIRIDY